MEKSTFALFIIITIETILKANHQGGKVRLSSWYSYGMKGS